jgi:hypothetical protein
MSPVEFEPKISAGEYIVSVFFFLKKKKGYHSCNVVQIILPNGGKFRAEASLGARFVSSPPKVVPN